MKKVFYFISVFVLLFTLTVPALAAPPSDLPNVFDVWSVTDGKHAVISKNQYATTLHIFDDVDYTVTKNGTGYQVIFSGCDNYGVNKGKWEKLESTGLAVPLILLLLRRGMAFYGLLIPCTIKQLGKM